MSYKWKFKINIGSGAHIAPMIIFEQPLVQMGIVKVPPKLIRAQYEDGKSTMEISFESNSDPNDVLKCIRTILQDVNFSLKSFNYVPVYCNR